MASYLLFKKIKNKIGDMIHEKFKKKKKKMLKKRHYLQQLLESHFWSEKR